MNLPDARMQLLEAAIAEGPGELFGLKLRPVSLGTLNLCRRLGLSLVLHHEQVALISESERQRQVMLFVWMHSAPLTEVLAAVRDGSWDVPFGAFAESSSELIVPEVLAEIRRVSQRVDAALVEVLPKPGRSSDDEAPGDILEPGFTASLVFTLARETGWAEAFLLWQLPLACALQYYHCALRASLAWTVKPGPPVQVQINKLEQWAAALTPDEDDE